MAELVDDGVEVNESRLSSIEEMPHLEEQAVILVPHPEKTRKRSLRKKSLPDFVVFK